MSISQLILTHVNILRHYVTMICIIYKMGEKNGVILHLNVSRAIFLLFNDDQDTKPE